MFVGVEDGIGEEEGWEECGVVSEEGVGVVGVMSRFEVEVIDVMGVRSVGKVRDLLWRL